jgi:hypothetical protein
MGKLITDVVWVVTELQKSSLCSSSYSGNVKLLVRRDARIELTTTPTRTEYATTTPITPVEEEFGPTVIRHQVYRRQEHIAN